MKWTIAGSIVILFVILVSCQKENGSANTASPVIDRKFRFQLYTNQDFSGDASVINFSIFIKNANHTLYDSVLAPLLIKDIPGVLNKLVIEKTVTESNNSNLTAGFRYEIENVGNSWYIDTSKAGNLFKIIDFAFQ